MHQPATDSVWSKEQPAVYPAITKSRPKNASILIHTSRTHVTNDIAQKVWLPNSWLTVRRR
jgi:hypothetical protein